jgi:chemotaxis protein methyltransferase CheR
MTRHLSTRGAASPVVKGTPDSGFAMTAEDFSRIRGLAFELCGISLSDAKVDMAYNRLARVLRQHGLTEFRQYLDAVEQGDGVRRQEFVNAMTTNLTRFFREASHFALLADYLRSHSPGDAIPLWCAGCSTGEEAYTIAMTAIEALGPRASSVRVLATDVDTNVLRQAASGIYRAEAARDLDSGRLRRFFLQGTGPNTGKLRVRPEVRQLVRFEHHNLRGTEWPAAASFAAVFCRNVLIYFNPQSQAAVLARFAECLRPQGLLFAGHSEFYAHSAHLWTRVAHSVYRPARDAETKVRRAPPLKSGEPSP